MASTTSLTICIFSYNRGTFLKNAIDSCALYAKNTPVCIVDDHSDDPETISVLNNLPKDIALLKPTLLGRHRHGGLYDNMQMALDLAPSEWVLFMQDDMQLVRPFDQDDAQYIEDFFSTFEQAAFLNPVFLKGLRRKRNIRITRTYDNFPGYYRDYRNKKTATGISYCDMVIGHSQRLRAGGWQFLSSEKDNAAQATERFGQMGCMANPFVMYLPQVPVYRGKEKTRAVQLAEKWSGSQPKRFVQLDPDIWQRFKRRPLEQLPVAEEFLQCEDPRVKKPYTYSAVNAYWPLRVWHKLTLFFTH